MRAMAIEGFGEPDQLRPMALPRPQADRGEVLIRVVAAGVARVDCLIREGKLDRHIPGTFPLIPGWDAAGVVEDFGAGATRFRKGHRVFACARKPRAQWGTYAEYVSVPTAAVAAMPAKLLFEEAASVPLAALAAQQCLDGPAPLAKDQTVLIHGAAGGVGHFAVQLAKLRGARVLTTAAGASQPFLIALGAQAAIDHDEDFGAVLLKRCPEGVDLVVDLVGGETLARSYAVVKPGGRLVSLVEEPDMGAAQSAGITAQAQFVEPSGEQLEQLGRLFDRKQLRTHVQKIFPLAKAAEAHELLEERRVQGKLVLNL